VLAQLCLRAPLLLCGRGVWGAAAVRRACWERVGVPHRGQPFLADEELPPGGVGGPPAGGAASGREEEAGAGANGCGLGLGQVPVAAASGSASAVATRPAGTASNSRGLWLAQPAGSRPCLLPPGRLPQ